MGTQLVTHTSGTSVPTLNGLLEIPIAWAGPDDGGIRRGDREDTGDNQAAPDQLGYEPVTGEETPGDDTGPEGDYYDGIQ